MTFFQFFTFRIKNNHLLVFLNAIIIIISSCNFNFSKTVSKIDQKILYHLDRSLIHSFEQVTLKQLHLEQDSYQGKLITIDATLDRISPGQTYLEVSNGSRKLLIIQVDIADFDHRATKQSLGKKLKITGKLESARKGLPALRAMLVKAIE